MATAIYTIRLQVVPQRLQNIVTVIAWLTGPTMARAFYSHLAKAARQGSASFIQCLRQTEQKQNYRWHIQNTAVTHRMEKQMAVVIMTEVGRNWKRYRGGTNGDIRIYDFDKQQQENISSTSDADDELPMWHENYIYFLSDRGLNCG